MRTPAVVTEALFTYLPGHCVYVEDYKVYPPGRDQGKTPTYVP